MYTYSKGKSSKLTIQLWGVLFLALCARPLLALLRVQRVYVMPWSSWTWRFLRVRINGPEPPVSKGPRLRIRWNKIWKWHRPLWCTNNQKLDCDSYHLYVVSTTPAVSLGASVLKMFCVEFPVGVWLFHSLWLIMFVRLDVLPSLTILFSRYPWICRNPSITPRPKLWPSWNVKIVKVVMGSNQHQRNVRWYQLMRPCHQELHLSMGMTYHSYLTNVFHFFKGSTRGSTVTPPMLTERSLDLICSQKSSL